MYEDKEKDEICMALAEKTKTDTYTVGDHAATATMADHLTQDLKFVQECGCTPYNPVFLVVNGKTCYRDRCQWHTDELEWFTPAEKSHRFWVHLQSHDQSDAYKSGWYIDSEKRERWLRQHADAPADGER